MDVVYPPNKRADRVNQLAEEIVYIQEEVKEAIQDEAAHDKKSLTMLESIAKKQGFKTFDDYLADVEKKLSPDDKKLYQNIKANFLSKDERINISLGIGVGLVGNGIKTGLTGTSIATLLQGCLLRVALQAIGVGLLKVLGGQSTEGICLLHAAGDIIQTAFKGELLSDKALTAFRVFKVVEKILSLGIPLGTIHIHIAIDGTKQPEELTKAIKELCVRRLTTKKIQQYARTTLTSSGDVHAILSYAQSLQELVDEGALTQKAADEKVNQKMLQFEPDLKEALNKIDDKSVYKLLQQQDITRKSWTNEDPSFDEIEKMIAQYEKEEK
ncbi:hypothetical protein AMATHDRAFT_68695 [Amanita thiersii Skay4041]|uniref:Uncharacterized protein n=1 Tax=Amanita thiersii Skay4041 TaxID=703135 RepID=A0A2A9NA20_9AGAR|nr:hypothetical protein AMATHDRAFT_68695 [Amanita thiersii Skay4041]